MITEFAKRARNRRKDWRKWAARRMEQARDLGSRVMLGLHVAVGVRSRFMMRAIGELPPIKRASSGRNNGAYIREVRTYEGSESAARIYAADGRLLARLLVNPHCVDQLPAILRALGDTPLAQRATHDGRPFSRVVTHLDGAVGAHVYHAGGHLAAVLVMEPDTHAGPEGRFEAAVAGLEAALARGDARDNVRDPEAAQRFDCLQHWPRGAFVAGIP